MKCPRCNSENMQMQTRAGKNTIMIGFVLAFAGIGLMFLGIFGLIIGALIGLLVGAILKAILPNPTETVAVCQSCGYTSKPIHQGLANNAGHPLFCAEDESTLSIHRESSSVGSAALLLIRIDAYPPFTVSNAMTANLKLAPGIHKITYEQSSGLGKKNRYGNLDVEIQEGNKYYANLSFTSNGLNVTKSW